MDQPTASVTRPRFAAGLDGARVVPLHSTPPLALPPTPMSVKASEEDPNPPVDDPGR
jgi:hypothetical protein